MKDRQITVAKIVLVVVFIAAPLLPLSPMIFQSVRDGRLRMRLLCKTDHVALRFAGGELLRETGQESVTSHGHVLHGSSRRLDVSQSPLAIRRLSPRGIRIEEDRLYIDFGGRTHNFGVIIYPADFNEPYPEYRGGDRKLVEGMWYYDDEYNTDPTHDEWVEARLRKNRTRRDRSRYLPAFQTDREVLEFLALLVQVWGLMATVALTFMFRRKKWAPDIGLGLGFVVNVVGQIGLAGGGPGACVGFFVFPLFGWLVSLLTLRLATWCGW
jgi:hypothetical protein